MTVVCCQVKVSVTGRSFAQRRPSECGVSLCVCLETSRMSQPWHALGCCARGEGGRGWWGGDVRQVGEYLQETGFLNIFWWWKSKAQVLVCTESGESILCSVCIIPSAHFQTEYWRPNAPGFKPLRERALWRNLVRIFVYRSSQCKILWRRCRCSCWLASVSFR